MGNGEVDVWESVAKAVKQCDVASHNSQVSSARASNNGVVSFQVVHVSVATYRLCF